VIARKQSWLIWLHQRRLLQNKYGKIDVGITSVLRRFFVGPPTVVETIKVRGADPSDARQQNIGWPMRVWRGDS